MSLNDNRYNKEVAMIWRDIQDSNYQVSSVGTVRNAVNKRTIKQYINRGGYPQCRMTIAGRRRTVEVHRLVAHAFVDNLFNLTQVNHINYDKTDNNFTNLEWCSASDNVRHSLGLRKRPRQRKYLQKYQIINILHIGHEAPTTLLGRLYGVDRTTISRIRKRKLVF